MAGRARVGSDKGDKVTLYIKRFSENEIASKIKYFKSRQDAYHDFRTSGYGSKTWFVKKYLLGEQIDTNEPKHWIGADDNSYLYESKYFINEIATTQVEDIVNTLESILKEIRNNETHELPGQEYLERQLGWFGKTYNKENDITLVGKNQGRKALIEMLEHYASKGIEMYDEEQKIFREEFTDLHDKVYRRKDKNKERIYGKSVITEILEDEALGYKLVPGRSKEGSKKTYWRIIKT